MANEIAHIFKGENPATYYVPFKTVGNKAIPPSGKLWHHYNYVKQRLREARLLVGHRKESRAQLQNIAIDGDFTHFLKKKRNSKFGNIF